MTTPTNCCFKDCLIKQPHTHNVEIVTPKPQSCVKLIEAAAKERRDIYNRLGEHRIAVCADQHFTLGAHFGVKLGIEECIIELDKVMFESASRFLREKFLNNKDCGDE